MVLCYSSLRKRTHSGFSSLLPASLVATCYSILLSPILLSTALWSGGASGKEPACQFTRHKRLGFDPWVEKIPWRRKWLLQYSGLENSMDRGTWQATVYGVAKSWTWLKWLSTQENEKIEQRSSENSKRSHSDKVFTNLPWANILLPSYAWASLVAQMVKNPPAMQETQV